MEVGSRKKVPFLEEGETVGKYQSAVCFCPVKAGMS